MLMEESNSMFLYSHAEVDQDLSYFATLEDEVTGLQHYLPECNLVGCSVGFETFSSLGEFNMGSFSRAIEHDQIKFDGDALDLYLAQEEETKGDRNGLQGTDNSVPLEDVSFQSTCQEMVLGAEAADTVSNLNCNVWEKSFLENTSIESHSSCVQERECHAEVSSLSASEAMVFESACDKTSLLLDKMAVQDLHQVFSRMFRRETSVMDKQWLKHHILFGLKNQGAIVDGLNLSEFGKTAKADEGKTVLLSSTVSSRSASDSMDISNDLLMSEEHVKREKVLDHSSLKSVNSPVRDVACGSIVETNTANLIVKQKQTYRPTRICTKGLQEQQSRYSERKCEDSTKNAREEVLLVKSRKQYHQALEGSCIPVPFYRPVQKAQLNNSLVDDSDDCKDEEASVSTEDFEMEASSANSEDDFSQGDCATRVKKARKQRRPHMRWTPSEVMKLIDGVSKYGVGKWTHIKKSLFSSSSHRTSANLKDKWRNLLKANCYDIHKKRKRENEGICVEASCNNMRKKRRVSVEQRETQASHQLPESVWRRIKELAVLYSYPGEKKTNASRQNAESQTISYHC